MNLLKIPTIPSTLSGTYEESYRDYRREYSDWYLRNYDESLKGMHMPPFYQQLIPIRHV